MGGPHSAGAAPSCPPAPESAAAEAVLRRGRGRGVRGRRAHHHATDGRAVRPEKGPRCTGTPGRRALRAGVA